MSQKFAAYDAKGTITGFYDDVDSPAPASATVIEITDAEWLTCLSTPGYTVQNGVLTAPAAPTAAEQLASEQTQLCKSIDSAVDQVYAGAIGHRLVEYQKTQSDATAFKAAGYAGTVPKTVQDWATASGMTPQAACDNILATATVWDGLVETMRGLRLIGKSDVTAATTVADAQASAATTIANIQNAALAADVA